MNYQQLIQPNLKVIGTAGDCLIYVREVFGVPAKYLTATLAWQNSQYKHSGTPPPVAVPIWFSYNQPAGHVAVWDNGKIYSTTAQGDKTFSSIQALMNYIGEDIQYLGWSEDINNVRVVEGEDMGLTADQVNKICVLSTDLQASTNQNFLNNAGLDLDTVLNNFLGYTESKNLRLDAEAYRAGEGASLNKTTVEAYIQKNLQ